MARVHKSTDEEPVQRGDDTYVYMRAEDRSIFMRLAYIQQKYSILWIPLLAILTVFGFDFKTPANAQKHLEDRVDSNAKSVQVQIDAIRHSTSYSDSARERTEHKLNVLLKLQCINQNLTDRDRRLAGLDCNDVLSADGR